MGCPGRRIKIYLMTLLALAGICGGCGRSAPPADPVAGLSGIDERMRACLPPRRYRKNDGNIRMAVTELSRLAVETKVRVVAYAGEEPGVFDLPVYSLSRGRWLISETGRAFLIDQNCRQYRLKGRSSTRGIPLDGRIELRPGQSFEADLSFPRLSERPYILIMVYGDLILPLPPLTSGTDRPASRD